MVAEDPQITLARRVECEADGLYFNRYFFKQRMNTKMIISRHHYAMQAALDRTMLPPSHPDFIPRLIINVPPRYTKTEMCSIGYIARGLAINSRAQFMHLSYSHKLALKNSAAARAIVKSKAFQVMWPMQTRNDADSKEIWHTTRGGGVTATAAGGQVTGFGGGLMEEDRFSGALIIDDPVKPDDAYSEIVREAVNTNYSETIDSRTALDTTPKIVVMQPIHWSDLTGFLLRGGSGEKWHHLRMPVYIDNAEPYPEEYTHGIPIEHGLPDGWLWRVKHNEKHEVALKAHRRRYWAQYMLKPIKRDDEKALWSEAVIAKAREKTFINPVRTVVAVDPATTNNPDSDEHGIGVATLYDDPNVTRMQDGTAVRVPVFSVDADYTCKGKPSEWAAAAIAAHDKHEAYGIVIETNQGGDMCEETLRNAGFRGKIIRVHAAKGKTLRAEPVAALYELGYVWHKTGLGLAEEEMLDFDPLSGKSNGKSPNRVDVVVYALTDLSGTDTTLGDLLEMIVGGG